MYEFDQLKKRKQRDVIDRHLEIILSMYDPAEEAEFPNVEDVLRFLYDCRRNLCFL